MIDSESREGKDRPATQAVWAGEGGVHWQGATQVPVVHSVSFGYDDLDRWRAVALGEADGHIYGRNTNPTVAVFEEKVRVLEGAEAATSFSTGMAAISDTLFTLLEPGQRVVSVTDTYGGTNRLFAEFLPRVGVDVTLCPTDDHRGDRGGHRRAACGSSTWRARPTRPARSSTWPGWPSGPRSRGAIVVVDNTLRHADQSASAGAGRPPGDPQRHEVPGRPRRRPGRRGGRRRGAGRGDLPPPRDHRGDPARRRRLPVAPRDEDAGPARRAAERQRPGDRAAPPGPSEGRAASSTRAWRSTRTTTSPGGRCPAASAAC